MAGVDPLLEEARSRASSPLSRRQWVTSAASAGGYLIVALGMLVGFGAGLSALATPTACLFVAAYLLVSCVEFEIGSGAAVPTELVLVPMLFVLPPAAVPVAVAIAYIAGAVVDVARRRLRIQRLPVALSTCWHAIGPAMVLAIWGSGQPRWHDLPLYAAALLAQFAFDLVSSLVRESYGFGIPASTVVAFLRPVFLVDALLAPAALTAAFVITPHPLALLGMLPMAGLLWVFAHERQTRIDQALALSHAYHDASSQARRDGLTGVLNRLGWDEALTSAAQHMLETGEPASILLVDVDGLKAANDLHGHEHGDAVITALARVLSHTIRERDVVARIGGDEFGILLFNCGPQECQRTVRRLDSMIHRQRTGNMPLSASIGHATCPPGTLHDAILHADQRMYETKRQRPSVAMAARTERRNRDA